MKVIKESEADWSIKKEAVTRACRGVSCHSAREKGAAWDPKLVVNAA
jgi:predicted CxxxxCH...CXXCH cytochrome family protein